MSQSLAMVSKAVTKKVETLEHHKALVHHGMLRLAPHLVCIQLFDHKTSQNLFCDYFKDQNKKSCMLLTDDITLWGVGHTPRETGPASVSPRGT